MLTVARALGRHFVFLLLSDVLSEPRCRLFVVNGFTEGEYIHAFAIQ